ncbi:hypothetical protein [Demequina maris]|uniref:hypothetical protein n=1 Tax=Demequina maris TaxID=1638982 RepID=UPI000780C300|nr:hypothetical protein [Demequina maris]
MALRDLDMHSDGQRRARGNEKDVGDVVDRDAADYDFFDRVRHRVEVDRSGTRRYRAVEIGPER